MSQVDQAPPKRGDYCLRNTYEFSVKETSGITTVVHESLCDHLYKCIESRSEVI